MSSSKKRRPSRATIKHIRAARAASKALGKVTPATDTRRDATGRPVLGPGQVYVTRAGVRYHDAWCPTIADAYDRNPRAVIVTAVEDTGDRTRCANCDRPLTG